MKSEVLKTVTVRLPLDLKEKLDAEVALNRSSQSSEVIRLLRAAWPDQAKAEAV